MIFQYKANRFFSQTFANVKNEMIQRVFDYAVHTKNVQMCEKFVTLFDRFRNLILITFCIVLFQIERLKISKKTIDNIMRICINDSQTNNLKRIRNDCILSNQIVAKLLDTNWKNKTWKIFLICEQQSAFVQKNANDSHTLNQCNCIIEWWKLIRKMLI